MAELGEATSYSPDKRNLRDDRVFILGPVEGKSVKDVAGRTDSRLFTGDNRLHAVKDPETGMWSLKYDKGTLPGPFQQIFTKYSVLENFIKNYYIKRNIEVKQVVD